MLANDTDPDGDSLIVTSVSTPSKGSAVITGCETECRIIYTPNVGTSGVDTFSYTVSDNNGGSSSANVSVTIIPPVSESYIISASVINSGGGGEAYPEWTQPQGGHDAYAIGDRVSFQGSSYESVISGNVWSPAAYPRGWMSIPNGGGGTSYSGSIDPSGDVTVEAGNSQTFTMTPDSGSRVKDILVDGSSVGQSTAYTFVDVTGNHTISVEFEEGQPPVNNAPITNNDSASVNAGESVDVYVLSNDSDADGDSLTVTSIGTPTKGNAVITGCGTECRINYTANNETSGTDSLTYTVSDGNGGTATGIITIQITGSTENSDPTVNNDIVTVSPGESVIINALANDTDPDGDDLEISAIADTVKGTAVIIDCSTECKIEYIANADAVGSETFEYTVIDGNGGSSVGSITVNFVVSEIGQYTESVLNNQFIGAGEAKFWNGDDETWTLDLPFEFDFYGTKYSTVYVSSNGVLDFVNAAVGQEYDNYSELFKQSVRIAPLWDDLSTDYAECDMYVHQPTSDSICIRWEGSTWSNDGIVNPVNVEAVLYQDGRIQFNYGSGNAGITPTIGISSGDNEFFTLSANHNDKANLENVESLLFTPYDFAPVNNAPVAVSDIVQVSQGEKVVISALTNDSDPDGDDLEITEIGSTIKGTAIITGCKTECKIEYIANADAVGTEIFEYTLSDGKGGTSTGSVTVNFIVNVEPPVANSDSVETDKGKAVTVTVLVNDTGDEIELVSVTNPTNGTSFAFVDSVIYTPNSDFSGVDFFNYTIKDKNGNTATALVRVTVQEIDNPNTVSFDAGNGTVEFNIDPAEEPWYGVYHLTGNISGVENGWNMKVNFSESQSIIYAFGSVQLSSDGEPNKLLSYGNTGLGSFDIYISGTPTKVLPSSIVFNGGVVENKPPVANDDTVSVEAGESIVISALSNDSDPDGDDLEITTVSNYSKGIAIITGCETECKIDYTANADAEGSDTITYTVSDGNGGTDTATVTVTIITGENQNPTLTIISPAANAVIEQVSLSPVTIEIKAEDTDGSIDSTLIEVDGQSFNDTNTAIWTPSNFGTFNILVRAVDNDGAAAMSMLIVTIKKKEVVAIDRQIIGYINQWDGWKGAAHGCPKQGALNHTNVDWDKYTIINFAFFGVAKDGSIHSGDYRNKSIYIPGEVQEPGPMVFEDKYSSFDPYFLSNAENCPSIFDLAREHDVKVMAAVGGWSMCKHFPETASNPTMRAKFIADCKKLIDMGFDGIDLDWEYPGHKGMNIEGASEADYHNYTILLKELREAIGPDKLLSSAINCLPSKIEKLEWSEIDKYLDYYNMMTYDIDGGWSNNAGHNSPLYQWKDASNEDNNISWDQTFKYLIEDLGIDSKKINLGMSFYGRGVETKSAAALGVETKKTLRNFYVDGPLEMAHDFVNFEEWEGTPYYYYIKQQTSSWTEHWDDVAKVPYRTNGNFFLSYDNERSLEFKAQYIVDNNVGGVIIWNAFGDLDMSQATENSSYGKVQTYSNVKHPLIDTVHRVFFEDN